MNQLRFALRAGTALSLFLLSLSPLAAQATRTWVSGVGDDVNPGSRTAPCKTFAGAIAKTEAGGEINCLDAGGFGAITITKSITIDGGGTHASILNSLTTGIIINGPDIVVTLRNLSIQGAGKGVTGIKLLNGAVLNVEQCVISGQAGRGIEMAPDANARVAIKDTIIRDNTGDPHGGGIRIAPGATFSVTALLDNVRLEGNLFGLLVNDRVSATLRNCVVAGNSTAGLLATGEAGPVNLNLENCLVAGNGAFGIRNVSTSVNSVIRLSNVMVTGHGMGLSANGDSIIRSFGNNRLDGNLVDGRPTETKLPE